MILIQLISKNKIIINKTNCKEYHRNMWKNFNLNIYLFCSNNNIIYFYSKNRNSFSSIFMSILQHTHSHTHTYLTYMHMEENKKIVVVFFLPQHQHLNTFIIVCQITFMCVYGKGKYSSKMGKYIYFSFS